MDAKTFDRWTAVVAQPPTRRAALRLLAGGMLGLLLPSRSAFAQRPDRDGDGLFDDDETDVYGTNPDNPDTDGDGDDDGLEVFNGTDPPHPQWRRSATRERRRLRWLHRDARADGGRHPGSSNMLRRRANCVPEWLH